MPQRATRGDPSPIAARGLRLGPLHRPAALVRRSRQTPGPPRPAQAGDGARRPRRKITATLYYVSDDGMALVPAQREVPFGATVVARRRAPSSKRRSRPRRRWCRRFRPRRSCATCSSPSAATRSSISPSDVIAKHPGGSLDEILTVYTLVNALTVNLPAITRVQILIDGKEVDTLAGHVDLRHPLSKNMEWVVHDTH